VDNSTKEIFERINVNNGLDLTDEQIQIAVLLDHGYSQEEIAARFGVSQQAISKKLAKIKKKCKGWL